MPLPPYTTGCAPIPRFELHFDPNTHHASILLDRDEWPKDHGQEPTREIAEELERRYVGRKYTQDLIDAINAEVRRFFSEKVARDLLVRGLDGLWRWEFQYLN